jgi:hypothetical protein
MALWNKIKAMSEWIQLQLCNGHEESEPKGGLAELVENGSHGKRYPSLFKDLG